jgi:cation:H+ antiporter
LFSGPSLGKTTERALDALWTFPGVVFVSFVLAWAAESAQFLVSQALSLAILAWLQTLPEFAVEAVIAWERNVPLITANFTGSLRLLVGLGWPLVYFTAAIAAGRNRRRMASRKSSGDAPQTRADRVACSRAKGHRLSSSPHAAAEPRFFEAINLEKEHAIEIMGLIPPLAYFWVIYFKGTLNMIDSIFLVLMYLAYLMAIRKVPPQETEKIEELERIPQKILSLRSFRKHVVIALLFLGGGAGILFIARPFLHSMLGLAVSLGVSQFVFVQWVAPFLSEFPEKLSAFYWAKTVKRAPMGFMNIVSSNINQWTLLVAMIPIVYSISSGRYSTVVFDQHQKMEILLTMAQSILGFILLANMEFRVHEAVGLFSLWFIQFVMPGIRQEITVVYFGWIAFECVLALLGKRKLTAFRDFKELWKEHSLGKGLLYR